MSIRDEIAAELDGTEYPLRISKEMQARAKEAGVVIVSGASDDLMEFDSEMMLTDYAKRIEADESAVPGVVRIVPRDEDKHIPAAFWSDLWEYHLAVAGEGSLAYTWSDKPHRLVYDLTRIIAEMRESRFDSVRMLPAKWRAIASEEVGDAFTGPWETCADELDAAMHLRREGDGGEG